MPRPTSFLVMAALGLVGLLAPPATAADWSAAPAANQFGSGREAFSYTLNPGGSAEDALTVTNAGSAPVEVTLTAPQWVEVQRRVTVQPGATTDVSFRVVLPDDARPGDHAGSLGGVPLRVRVSGPLTPSVAVEDVRVQDSRVTYVLHNTGNAILSARQSVKVSGPFGRFAATPRPVRDAAALLPGERRTVSTPVDDITPAVRLTATVTLLPLLTDEAGSTAALAPVAAAGHAWALPWPWLLGLLVVGAAVSRFTSRRSDGGVTDGSGRARRPARAGDRWGPRAWRGDGAGARRRRGARDDRRPAGGD